MSFFSQIMEMPRYLFINKLMAGLRILSGAKERHGEDGFEPPDLAANRDSKVPGTPRAEENEQVRMPSNRLGWYGKR